MRTFRIFFLLLLLTALSRLPAEARERLEHDETTVYYPAGAERMARTALDKTALIRLRIRRRFSVALGVVRIELVRGHPPLQALTHHPVPPWATAFASPQRQLIGIRIDQADVLQNRLVGTLKHELMHIALGQIEGQAGWELPRWFNEGVCEWYSGVMHFQGRQALTQEAALGHLIPFSQIDAGFPDDSRQATQAYRQSQSFVRYLAEQYPGSIRGTLQLFRSGRAMNGALEEAAGTEFATLEADWRNRVTPSHPWLYLLWNGLTLFGALGILVVIFYAIRKWRDRRMIAAWDDHEPWMTYDIDYTNWRGSEDP